MPHYISLVNWTEQGIQTVKESTKRVDTVNALASKLGAKMDVFYTMGEYDIVAVTEAPHDDAYAPHRGMRRAVVVVHPRRVERVAECGPEREKTRVELARDVARDGV